MQRPDPSLTNQDVRTILLLAALAFLLYLPGLGWGLPYANDPLRTHGWATDSLTPLEPLSQVAGLLSHRADRYLGYPLMHDFVLLLAYAPYLVFLWITGGLQHPGADFPFGLADPVGSLQKLEMIGKLVSMIMAAGIVAAAYVCARILWNRSAALLAAVFTMLLYPMSYYSRTGNLDVPALFWSVLGLAVYARTLVSGVTTRRMVWLGIFAAFAIATKDQSWAAFALLPPVLIILQRRQSAAAGTPFAWRPLLWGFFASVAAYACATGMVVNPERHLAHIGWVRAHVPFPEGDNVASTAAGYLDLLGRTWNHLLHSNGPLMLAAAAIGVWTAAHHKLHLTFLLPVAGHIVLVLIPARTTLLRYILPMAFIVCLFAACALAAGLNAGRWKRRLSRAAAMAICGWLAAFDFDLTYQMLRDSHYNAALWLDRNARSGDRVGTVAATASLPRMKDGLRYFLMIRENLTPEKIREHRPEFIVIMPDWTTPKNGIHPRWFPQATYALLANGELGYRLAARFQTPAWIPGQILDYPTVNPPIEIYAIRQP
jgi:hypothetical protein